MVNPLQNPTHISLAPICSSAAILSSLSSSSSSYGYARQAAYVRGKYSEGCYRHSNTAKMPEVDLELLELGVLQ
ncbi:MAG: hypothetical protein WDZ94_02910 [Patescibacteria group bacterium]